jgi:hypothetical protein
VQGQASCPGSRSAPITTKPIAPGAMVDSCHAESSTSAPVYRLPQAGEEERSVTRPQVGAEEASVAPEAGARQERRKERTPPVDWAGRLRRTFAVDVFTCIRCGGRRRVLAYVKGAGGGRAIVEHLGLPTAGASLTRRERHPRAHGVEAYAATAKRADAPAAPLRGGRPGQACPRRLRGLSTGRQPLFEAAGIEPAARGGLHRNTVEPSLPTQKVTKRGDCGAWLKKSG